MSGWIVSTGFWDDTKTWDDTQTWNDVAPTGQTLDVSVGSFSLTGFSSTFSLKLPATKVSLSFTGIDASFGVSRNVLADTRSFAFTGNAISGLRVVKLNVVSVDFGSSSGNTTLELAKKLPSDAISFNVTGRSARVFRSFTLPAGDSSFISSYDNTDLLLTRNIPADSVAFVYSASNVDLSIALTTNVTSFSLNGIDASLQQSYSLSAATASYDLVINDITTIYNHSLFVSSGDFHFTPIRAFASKFSIDRVLSPEKEDRSVLVDKTPLDITINNDSRIVLV